MAARRAVRDAVDEDAKRRARDRVQDAKVALGERGPRWWAPMTPGDREARRAATVRAVTRRLGTEDGDGAVRALADESVAHLLVAAG